MVTEQPWAQHLTPFCSFLSLYLIRPSASSRSFVDPPEMKDSLLYQHLGLQESLTPLRRETLNFLLPMTTLFPFSVSEIENGQTLLLLDSWCKHASSSHILRAVSERALVAQS